MSGRRWRLLILVGAMAAAGSGCVGFPEDMERMDREMAGLRQEVAGAAKNHEAARAIYEERLARLEGGPRAASAPPGAQVELNQRLHELLGEYRVLQGKLEENAAMLEQLQRRVDGLERSGPAETRRGNGSVVPSPRRAPAAPAPVAPASQPTSPPPALPAQPAVPPRGSTPAAAAPLPRPQSAPAPEEAYKKALADYTRGNYDVAISSFRAFVAKHPGTSQAANAQYWLAESYYSQRNYAQAAEEFGAILRDYPDSSKVPSALFKQGDAYQQLKDTRQATAVLCELIGKYPKSREAQLARDRNVRCR